MIERSNVPIPRHSHSPLDAIIHKAKVSAVKTVYVNGEIVYQDGKFTKIDVTKLMREIAEQMAHELT